MSRSMKALTESSFVADELRLFLDTHPENDCARADYRAASNMAQREKKQLGWAVNAMDAGAGHTWDWVETPWPWERGE